MTRGDVLIRIGALAFVLGLASLLAAVVPFLLGDDNPPLPFTLGSYAMVAGIALGGLGLRLQTVDRRRS